ncbi:MAG: hypothetical protein Q8N37_02475 [bacterium]|nr:hypothetical protein [bacterium]
MNYIIKNIFFSVLLVAIIELLLITNISDFFIGVLFLGASFFLSLSVGGQSFTLARLPFLFIIGWFLFFYLTPGEIIGKGFLFVTGGVFFIAFCVSNYFSSLYKILPNITGEDSQDFIKKYEFARNLILALLFLVAFIWYTDAFIIYSVLGLPFYITLLVIFSITFFLSSFVLKVYSISDKADLNQEFLLYAWTSGLVIGQISWIVGFWPFGYLTAAFIITIIYYTIISVLKEYLFGRFEKKYVIAELAFAALIIIIIFNYTKWLPL